MTRKRTDYMREYMRKRRAAEPTSRGGRAILALTQMRARMDGNTSPLALELLAMIDEVLG